LIVSGVDRNAQLTAQPVDQFSGGDRESNQGCDDAGCSFQIAANVGGGKIRWFHGGKGCGLSGWWPGPSQGLAGC
jgi:hypothetical protein